MTDSDRSTSESSDSKGAGSRSGKPRALSGLITRTPKLCTVVRQFDPETPNPRMTNIDVLISGGSNPDLVGEIRRIVGGLRPFIDMGAAL